ncbi:MAG: tRNA lysidine(34) synthetase TilS, partial [Planctomycetes bacterium]|nr:tRNA lysidine(34) synthetase TilS [Planctomycetota bacterium]
MIQKRECNVPTVTEQFEVLFHRGLSECLGQSRRVLVAVSGGADSVALLRGMLAVRNDFSLELIVGHFNHKLRGEASDRDARWVSKIAETYSLPFVIQSADENTLHLDQSGLEESARNVRYSFLQQKAIENKCDAIAMAHTADDQIETILHHVFRGTGIAGLRGIPKIRHGHPIETHN